MKRQVALALAGVTLLSVCAVGVTANATRADNPWTLIDNGYYSPVSISGEAPVLIRRIVDSDLIQQQTMLIDLDTPKDTEAAEAAIQDPDVILPDNMLPDGTLLNADLYQRRDELLMGLSTKMVLTDTNTGYTNETGSKQALTVRFADNSSSNVGVERVDINGKMVLVPQTLDNASADVVITPDGSKAIAYTERDMWLTSATTRGSSSVLPQTYNGKSYNDLADESFETLGANYALWCGQVTASPDSKKVAYVANKDDLNGLSVFTYDFETNQEKLLVGAPGSYYLIVDWLDSQNILCYKLDENDSKETVVVNVDGTESNLNFEVRNPSIIYCMNGLIAYSSAGEEDSIYVGQFNGADVEPVFSSQLNGTLRIRPGVNPFSPDGTQLAIIYVPDNEPENRLAKVFDLTEQTSHEIAAAKSRSAINTCVLEVSWIDDSSLLTVTVQDENDGQSNYATWSYALNGGDNNV